MTEKCDIVNAIETIKAGGFFPVAFVGGSLTVGTGASNTAEPPPLLAGMREYRKFTRAQVEEPRDSVNRRSA